MGSIDHSLFENYKKALAEKDLEQAKRAVGMAKIFKEMVEQEGFIDYSDNYSTHYSQYNRFSEPTSYLFYPESRLVVINNFQVYLSHIENRLFEILTLYESTLERVTVISRDTIYQNLWPNEKKSKVALRILIYRLRKKIEPDYHKPQYILSVHNKGYIFWAKRVK